MQIDSSASRTGSECASAVEWAITVRMPISRQGRMDRRAVSPRLERRILGNAPLLRREHRRHELPAVQTPGGTVQRPALAIDVAERRLHDEVTGDLGVLRVPRLPRRGLHVLVVDEDRNGLGRLAVLPERDSPSARPPSY